MLSSATSASGLCISLCSERSAKINASKSNCASSEMIRIEQVAAGALLGISYARARSSRRSASACKSRSMRRVMPHWRTLASRLGKLRCPIRWLDMRNFKGTRSPINVVLVCIRWYAAYPLSYPHLEEIMQECGVSVDHLSINRWAIRFLPLIEKMVRKYKRPVGVLGGWIRPTSRLRAYGNTSTATSTSMARPSTSC